MKNKVSGCFLLAVAALFLTLLSAGAQQTAPKPPFDLIQWNGGSGGTWSPFNSALNTNPWAAGMPVAGQGAPFYLRWVLDILGPARSALVAYDATVL